MCVEWYMVRSVDAGLIEMSATRSLRGSHFPSSVVEFDLARAALAAGGARWRHGGRLTIVNFARGQCRHVGLRPPPSFRAASIVVRRHVSKWYICHSASPCSQPDADDDHIKCDGGDRHDHV